MKFGRATTLLFALLVITTHRLPAPIREEPTPTPAVTHKAKAESKKSEKSPAAESGMSSQSVHAVLTDNARAAIAYLKGYVQTYESMPLAGSSDVRPNEILQQLREVLSRRFRNVSIAETGGESSSGGLIMLFDLQAHVGSISGTKNTVFFVATFKNGGKVLRTIAASGTSTIPYPAFGTRFPKALDAAFADFAQKLAAR
ncbi:MAG: hypothetical protein QOF93_88 [Verrucomicrobiota bacterium]|jgi:hypothetical protein